VVIRLVAGEYVAPKELVPVLLMFPKGSYVKVFDHTVCCELFTQFTPGTDALAPILDKSSCV
jgi:hypothetical protein